MTLDVLFGLGWSVCSINTLHWSAVSSMNFTLGTWLYLCTLLSLIKCVGYLVPRKTWGGCFVKHGFGGSVKGHEWLLDGCQLSGKLCTANTMNKPSAPWAPCCTKDCIEYVTGQGANLIWRRIPPGLRWKCCAALPSAERHLTGTRGPKGPSANVSMYMKNNQCTNNLVIFKDLFFAFFMLY